MTATFAKTAQPTLAALTARFLARPVAGEAEAGVEPHEVTAGFTADARTTWTEATAAAKLLGVKDLPSALPGEWAGYSRSATAAFLPLAVGHFPQQVRDVSSLLTPTKATVETRGWNVTSAKSTFANAILRAAAARTAGDFADATRQLDEAESLAADEAATGVVRNERAVSLWLQGRVADAVAIWKQSDNALSAFNLGVAALATGNKADAAGHLKTAVAQLPETSGWHHLARLYLALAS